MLVRDAMCTKVQFINPNTTLAEAAKCMRDQECGYLPIGENDRLTGAVTDRDIVIRGIAEGKDPNRTPVNAVMSPKIVYCYEEDDLEDAAEKMKDEKIRRLVVLNNNKRLVGVLSVGDIARECDDQHLTGDIEEKIAKAA